jgi:hypothetical protein
VCEGEIDRRKVKERWKEKEKERGRKEEDHVSRE